MFTPSCRAIMPTRDSKVPPRHSLDYIAVSKGPGAVYVCASNVLENVLDTTNDVLHPHTGHECSCDAFTAWS